MNSTARPGTSRREFLETALLGAVGLLAAPVGCCHAKRGAASATRRRKPPVAFNTANLVARISGYHFELKHWGEQHQKTIAATDEAAWRSICREIAAAGFQAVEIWEAHAAPEALNQGRAATWKHILEDHGLRPIAYAGGLRRETLQVCQWLGIPHVDGGLRELSPPQATDLCRQFGISFNLENHPEKDAAELLKSIDGGNEWLGVCIDTGWLGTQGASAPEVIRACGKRVCHTHIKDVKAAGAHETCALGEGVANVTACLKALKDIGYAGAYSWEDEPEDRNPFDSAVRNRRWLEERLG